jgi:hypothetical protein
MTTRVRFQKRHYSALASVVRGARRHFTNGTATEVVSHFERELAELFASDNPEFRPATFHDACRPGNAVGLGAASPAAQRRFEARRVPS